jgi:hypothetical protein
VNLFVFFLILQFANGDTHQMKSVESYSTLESCNEAAADIARGIVQDAANLSGIPTRGYYRCIKEGTST